MFTYEEEIQDYGPLTVIRLAANRDEGLVLAPVVRPRYDILTAMVSRTLLADQLIRDRLRKWPMQLSEFDEPVQMQCLVDRRAAEDFSTYVSFTNGYTYAGYGAGASGFGYDDDTTVAWIVPNKSNPAIFWRRKDPNGEGRIMTWLNLHADDMEDGVLSDEHYTWPDMNDEARELVEPQELKDLRPRHRRGGARRAGTY